MRLPTSTRVEPREERQPQPHEDGRSSGTGLARKALTAVALTALAYLLWRRTRSGEPVPWADEGRGEGAVQEGGESTQEVRARTGEPASGGDLDVEMPEPDEGGAEGGRRTAEAPPSVDPTLEEVDERVEADVDEEPAEPGEVTVSEEVAEEAGEGVTGEDTGDVTQQPDEEGEGAREAERSDEDVGAEDADESEGNERAGEAEETDEEA